MIELPSFKVSKFVGTISRKHVFGHNKH